MTFVTFAQHTLLPNKRYKYIHDYNYTGDMDEAVPMRRCFSRVFKGLFFHFLFPLVDYRGLNPSVPGYFVQLVQWASLTRFDCNFFSFPSVIR